MRLTEALLLGGGLYLAYKAGLFGHLGAATTPLPAPQPGGPTLMAADQALDIIWQRRPDLGAWYRGLGRPVDTVAQQRACVRDWLAGASEANVLAAGRDPVRYVQLMRWV